MRYPATEKLEIIRLVERSHLPAKQTLGMLGVPRATFYRWYERYRLEGQDALKDKAPLPVRIWNRIPDKVRDQLLELALDRPELSPRPWSSLYRHRVVTRPMSFISPGCSRTMAQVISRATSPIGSLTTR